MGFMGSGKSSVGPLVAKRLGWPFRDLDRVLEARFGLPANRQLAQFGEAEFRRREVISLDEQLGLYPLVLALGGGTVTDLRSRSLIREAGSWRVWMEVDWATVSRRLEGSDRPLWQTEEAERRSLFERRAALYRSFADLRVDARVPAPEVASRLIQALEARGVG